MIEATTQTPVVQAFLFAGLVGAGFLGLALLLQFYYNDDRDEVHVVLTLFGASILLLSNRAISTDLHTSSFLIHLGGGTLLFVLGYLTHSLLTTIQTDDGENDDTGGGGCNRSC